jgi:hypothetical protein
MGPGGSSSAVVGTCVSGIESWGVVLFGGGDLRAGGGVGGLVAGLTVGAGTFAAGFCCPDANRTAPGQGSLVELSMSAPSKAACRFDD